MFARGPPLPALPFPVATTHGMAPCRRGLLCCLARRRPPPPPAWSSGARRAVLLLSLSLFPSLTRGNLTLNLVLSPSAAAALPCRLPPTYAAPSSPEVPPRTASASSSSRGTWTVPGCPQSPAPSRSSPPPAAAFKHHRLAVRPPPASPCTSSCSW